MLLLFLLPSKSLYVILVSYLPSTILFVAIMIIGYNKHDLRFVKNRKNHDTRLLVFLFNIFLYCLKKYKEHHNNTQVDLFQDK